MKGLMQDDQLVLTRLLERASTLWPDQAVRSHTSGGMHRETYRELEERAARLACGLRSLGVGAGDRVASFAWNSWRHLELYFAVPCMGAVLHTLNIRLHPKQVAWIANDAEDRVIVADRSLLPVFTSILRSLRSVEHVIVLGEGDSPTYALDYEELVASSARLEWPELREDDACTMSYTSGTTGRPKGVLFSHRSMVLHAFMLNQAAVYGLTDRDTVLPIVPMFHANCWGLPYAAPLAGANLVFTGEAGADPRVICELIENERVTLAGAVPTVWHSVLRHADEHPVELSSLRAVVAGGSAVSATLIREFQARFNVPLWHGWGMTETGPLGTLGRLPAWTDDMDDEERLALQATQGRPVPGMRLRVVDFDAGREVPWDGATVGELEARGPWVARSYYHDDSGEAFDQGWLRTGDVAVVEPGGFIRIVDRTKDLVKSGGEWISSMELESALLDHPGVLEAAVIAMPDERWGERPLACVVLRNGADVDVEKLLEHLRPRFPKWWLPDRIDFVDEIPRTSVGKLDKQALRGSRLGLG